MYSNLAALAPHVGPPASKLPRLVIISIASVTIPFRPSAKCECDKLRCEVEELRGKLKKALEVIGEARTRWSKIVPPLLREVEELRLIRRPTVNQLSQTETIRPVRQALENLSAVFFKDEEPQIENLSADSLDVGNASYQRPSSSKTILPTAVRPRRSADIQPHVPREIENFSFPENEDESLYKGEDLGRLSDKNLSPYRQKSFASRSTKQSSIRRPTTRQYVDEPFKRERVTSAVSREEFPRPIIKEEVTCAVNRENFSRTISHGERHSVACVSSDGIRSRYRPSTICERVAKTTGELPFYNLASEVRDYQKSEQRDYTQPVAALRSEPPALAPASGNLIRYSRFERITTRDPQTLRTVWN